LLCWGPDGRRLSLDVTAGSEVAYAQALLLCGSQQELGDNPDSRLRLTLSGQMSDCHEDLAALG